MTFQSSIIKAFVVTFWYWKNLSVKFQCFDVHAKVRKTCSKIHVKAVHVIIWGISDSKCKMSDINIYFYASIWSPLCYHAAINCWHGRRTLIRVHISHYCMGISCRSKAPAANFKENSTDFKRLIQLQLLRIIILLFVCIGSQITITTPWIDSFRFYGIGFFVFRWKITGS